MIANFGERDVIQLIWNKYVNRVNRDLPRTREFCVRKNSLDTLNTYAVLITLLGNPFIAAAEIGGTGNSH